MIFLQKLNNKQNFSFCCHFDERSEEKSPLQAPISSGDFSCSPEYSGSHIEMTCCFYCHFEQLAGRKTISGLCL